VIYHKNNGNRFFLSFEAKFPNPEPSKGKKGCAAVADFWVNIGYMSKTDALLQLETCCQATLKEWLLAFFFVNPFLQSHWFLNQH
jgi:hypothetical protein